MSAPRYTTYHPRWHRVRMPIFWWLERWNYTKFITRELTSLFVAYAALLLLVEARCLARGASSFERLQEWLRRPSVLLAHAIVLAFLLVHSVTWLNLAPRAIEVRLGGKRIPAQVVLLGHYALWLGTSAAILWLEAGR